MLSCDGICTHSRMKSQPKELGKKWQGQGATENNKVSHTNCFAKFSATFFCGFQICLSCSLLSNLLTVGQPQPIFPKRFFTGNQNTTTKIILFQAYGQTDQRAPNHATVFILCETEAYIIFLSHLPDSQSVLPLWSSHSLLPCLLPTSSSLHSSSIFHT